MTDIVKNYFNQSTYPLWIGGEWIYTETTFEVKNKYTGETICSLADAQEQEVARAVQAAKAALKDSGFGPYQRYEVLMKVVEKMRENRALFAHTLAQEVGKPIQESYVEVDRAIQTMLVSAEEAKRIHGEMVPVEAAPGSENRMAFTLRVPVGIVAAITPFNVPLNLVCHKVGPAIAAGNAVVLKPSPATPLVAYLLCKMFEEAGLPKGRLNLVTGGGREVGQWLVKNQDINYYTFTGSYATGKWIRENIGIRRASLELGSNSATIVHEDADVPLAAKLCALRSFSNSGQVCISVQRIYVHENIYDSFLQEMKQVAEQLVVGDPMQETTQIGPMISENEAIRVESWIREAVEQGARIVTGGKREGAFVLPTILADVRPEMKVVCREVFGPVVSVIPYRDFDRAIAEVNNSEYGLQAGVFTQNLNLAMKAAREIETGGVIINDTSAYRVDHMPYGGVKNSGTSKEGPRYAIEEMTEQKLVVLNL